MRYLDWKSLYAACPGRVDREKHPDHAEPRALPDDDRIDWRLCYVVCGQDEGAVRAWLEELMPPEARLVITDGPQRRHGHICAVRTVVLTDSWFLLEAAASSPYLGVAGGDDIPGRVAADARSFAGASRSRH